MHVIAVTAEGVPTIASLFAVLTESASPILPRSLIRFDIEDGAFTIRTALWADGFSEEGVSEAYAALKAEHDYYAIDCLLLGTSALNEAIRHAIIHGAKAIDAGISWCTKPRAVYEAEYVPEGVTRGELDAVIDMAKAERLRAFVSRCYFGVRVTEAVLSDGTRCYRWGGQVARMMHVRAERKGRGLVVTVTLDIDNGEIEKARFAEIVRRNVKRKYGAGELIEVEVEGNF